MESVLAPDEDERREDLRELGLDDPAPMPELDPVPEAASRALDTSWAAVNVVTEDGQRSLASRGPVPEGPIREHSFCNLAIQTPGEVFVVEDATRDPELADNPFVAGDPNLRFYAGAVIESPRGHGLGTVCVFDDEPHRLSEDGRETLEALSQLVADRLRARHRTEQLEEANEDLDRFAAFVGHELADPISQVVGNLELLDRETPPDDESVRELLEPALEGAQRTERMARQLLKYARATGRELEPEPVDLDSVLDAVRQRIEPRIQETGGMVTAEPLPTVRADPSLIDPLLYNLVRNGIQHGGPEPHVHVWSQPTEDGHRILVEDAGPGIPIEDQQAVFELFGRGSQTAAPGSGVGLALCRRAVERHGSRIVLESSEGEGACFSFTLPGAD